jgi:hypothetical protein
MASNLLSYSLLKGVAETAGLPRTSERTVWAH